MSEIRDGLKLLISYNIIPELTQEYYEFVLGRYVPAMQSLGLEMSEAWHTAYGDYPNRLIAFVARDPETMRDLLKDGVWDELNEKLQEYVTDFQYKVVPYEVGFQI
jgi:hypothetical protein